MLFSEKFQVLTPFFAEVPTGGRGAGGACREGELAGDGEAVGEAGRGEAEGETSGEADSPGEDVLAPAEVSEAGRWIVHQSPAAAARIRHRPRAIHQR